MTTPPLAYVLTVSHIALEATDLARSIEFYRDTLGFEIFHDDRDSVVQPNVKGVIAGFGVELAQARDASPHAVRRRIGMPPGAPCVSFTVTNMDQAFAALQARGLVEAAQPSEVQGVKYFTFFDPDGQPIELIQFPAPLRTLADLRAR